MDNLKWKIWFVGDPKLPLEPRKRDYFLFLTWDVGSELKNKNIGLLDPIQLDWLRWKWQVMSSMYNVKYYLICKIYQKKPHHLSVNTGRVSWFRPQLFLNIKRFINTGQKSIQPWFITYHNCIHLISYLWNPLDLTTFGWVNIGLLWGLTTSVGLIIPSWNLLGITKYTITGYEIKSPWFNVIIIHHLRFIIGWNWLMSQCGISLSVRYNMSANHVKMVSLADTWKTWDKNTNIWLIVEDIRLLQVLSGVSQISVCPSICVGVFFAFGTHPYIWVPVFFVHCTPVCPVFLMFQFPNVTGLHVRCERCTRCDFVRL